MGLLNRAQEIFGDKTFKDSVLINKRLYVRGGEVSGREQFYTPTFQGFGTPTVVNFSWVREGNKIKIIGRCTAGTTTAVEARVYLPNSLLSDPILIPNTIICGSFTRAQALAGVMYCTIGSGVGYVTFGYSDAATQPFAAINGNTAVAASTVFGIQCELPIQGWNT